MREALINAVYHRGYDGPPEPVKVYLYPDRVEIISYPGPLHGLRREHLGSSGPRAVLPARNRRVGDFLKELRLAEARGTGIPKIWQRLRDNGSPPPEFDFDEERTYFRITIYPHKEYVLEEEQYLYASGQQESALELLRKAVGRDPADEELAEACIWRLCGNFYINEAVDVLNSYTTTSNAEQKTIEPGPFLALASAFNIMGQPDAALRFLAAMPASTRKRDLRRYAEISRQAGDPGGALETIDANHNDADEQDPAGAVERRLCWMEAAEAWAMLAHEYRSSEREQALCEAMGLLERLFDDQVLRELTKQGQSLPFRLVRAQKLYEDILRQLKLPLPYRPGSSPWSGRA